MKVFVDRDLCYGSAECAHRAPAVFEFVDGFGVVRPGREQTAEDPEVLEAVEKCPSQAIGTTGSAQAPPDVPDLPDPR
ncbi:ferredoxin [Streptomyces sp. SID5643]|uniref:ferredoxin n=1 Tax=Streptomyces sp. SID5643 TaxID=2690307 RepID=UPI001371EEA3|nr:ferredoxin [Streptomyces sp. SID5643]MZF85488.1 ferredoxin [Streptomyces sp. SID5643]